MLRDNISFQTDLNSTSWWWVLGLQVWSSFQLKSHILTCKCMCRSLQSSLPTHTTHQIWFPATFVSGHLFYGNSFCLLIKTTQIHQSLLLLFQCSLILGSCPQALHLAVWLKVSVWARCPLVPITSLVRHFWPQGSCQNILPHLHWRPSTPPASKPADW